MQLPRGTFREIRKGEPLAGILEDLERTKFSGISSISSPSGSGTLVLKGGKCILVKFLGKSGDAGWDELQKFMEEEVDAALSTLDEAQIQLSLEFNKACRIIKGGKTIPEPVRPATVPSRAPPEPGKKPAPPVHPPPQSAPVRPPLKPAAPTSTPFRPAPPVQASPVPEQKVQKPPSIFQRPAMPAPPKASTPPAPQPEEEVPEKISENEQTSSSFENDIDTFDTMDLDNVTDKIRNDCKTMIKQLHLDHLMER